MNIIKLIQQKGYQIASTDKHHESIIKCKSYLEIQLQQTIKTLIT